VAEAPVEGSACSVAARMEAGGCLWRTKPTFRCKSQIQFVDISERCSFRETSGVQHQRFPVHREVVVLYFLLLPERGGLVIQNRGRRGAALISGLTAGVAITLSACGGSSNAQSVARTVTVTVVASSTTGTSDGSPEPPSTGGSSAESGGTTTAGPVPPSAAGTPLKLANFFNVDSDWAERPYDIADRRQEQGIGREIRYCNKESAPFLELRLANNFKTLKFEVGQSNASNASDQALMVDVSGNNEQIDVRRIPFNKIQAFAVPVNGVNALRISFYLDPAVKNCGFNSVEAAMYNAVLD
jgi:hypothetical protein